MHAENHSFEELSADQRREVVNSEQRFRHQVESRRRHSGYLGSMVFVDRGGVETLVRDYYDARSGVKRQKSLGRRSAETEALLAQFRQGKVEAAKRLKAATEALARQAAINRVLRLGRVPETGARIVRALDETGVLGKGMRVVGTNALYAYEAACGVHLAPDVTTTEDIDILPDSRSRLRLLVEDGDTERTFLGLLKRVDKSFAPTPRPDQASNDEGYLVDLIQPLRDPPWATKAPAIGPADLEPVEIAGLAWQESAPSFESVAIDVRGMPVRMVVPDPRAFAVHKLWLSRQPDRDPVKRRRDEAQARVVAGLVTRHLLHLPFETRLSRSFPRDLVEAAAGLFEADASSSAG